MILHNGQSEHVCPVNHYMYVINLIQLQLPFPTSVLFRSHHSHIQNHTSTTYVAELSQFPVSFTYNYKFKSHEEQTRRANNQR